MYESARRGHVCVWARWPIKPFRMDLCWIFVVVVIAFSNNSCTFTKRLMWLCVLLSFSIFVSYSPFKFTKHARVFNFRLLRWATMSKSKPQGIVFNHFDSSVLDLRIYSIRFPIMRTVFFIFGSFWTEKWCNRGEWRTIYPFNRCVHV